MNFGNSSSEEESCQIVDAAIDSGINFIDTANVYGKDGASERILGRALQGGKRDNVVLATKFWAGGKGPNDHGGGRYHVMNAVEQSLQRLQTDHIDLYIMHRPEREWPGTPIEETLSALSDLVRQGKVRYIGTSNFCAWRMVEAQWGSKHLGLERFVADQLNYNIMTRYPEAHILRVARKYGVGITVWSPLNWGWLAGKYRRDRPLPEDSWRAGRRIRYDTEEGKRNLDIVEQLIPLAEARGLTLSQFSLAWLLKNPAVTSVICGPRILSHLEDNVKADEVELDDEAMAAVDRIVPPATHVGEWW
jgi:aryl-alcohol dehydrogenase-like predicted oxidoreductase